MTRHGLSVEERLRLGSEPDASGCLLWRGALNSDGYGHLKVDGRMVGVHRLAYGDVPAGQHVLHRCDVRHCIQRSHLFVGPNADNVRDKVAKSRQQRLVGEANGRAKLTATLVRDIRNEYRRGYLSQSRLASLTGVTQSTISKAIRGDTWTAS